MNIIFLKMNEFKEKHELIMDFWNDDIVFVM